MQSAQAEQAKEFGNTCLARGKLDAAIAAYSEAICLAPKALYYTNRAQAIKRRSGGNWRALVCEDCRSALRLDDKSIKAHYLLGCTLSELGDFVLATEHLQRALGLTAQTSVSYTSEIRRAMLAANKRVRRARLPARAHSPSHRAYVSTHNFRASAAAPRRCLRPSSGGRENATTR